MSDQNHKLGEAAGLIPDFFHDLIAYLIPGYTFIILLTFNIYVFTNEFPPYFETLGIVAFLFISIIGYVIGRAFEQMGYKFIHRRKIPGISNKDLSTKPKWALLFDTNNKAYTASFKNNAVTKIEEWLKNQDGEKLIEQCKSTNDPRDDYFNLIQFYLRERFPNVAIYEKKQNANIVLTRSLACIFLLNPFLYFIYSCILMQNSEIEFSPAAFLWVIANLLLSLIFYSRFQQDKTYHAMYILETFIAMKKLLTRSE